MMIKLSEMYLNGHGVGACSATGSMALSQPGGSSPGESWQRPRMDSKAASTAAVMLPPAPSLDPEPSPKIALRKVPAAS